MGWFDAFRDGGSNTYYGTQRTAVTIDVKQIIILFFSFVIAVALLTLVIGSRGRERWTTLLRLIFSLHTCVVILVCIFGHGWQTGTINTQCQYSSNYHGDINAHLGLHLGLKHINITLTGDINVTEHMGHIDYNERFNIDKVKYMEKQYRAEVRRGLPWPILSVAEYFYEDSGGLRWMRHIHEAGHFTFIILWCALVFWTMGNILIGFVVSRGALFMACSGISMVTACVIYGSLQPLALVIPLGGQFLTISYGWCFYLCIISGVITTCSGIAVLVALFYNPTSTSRLFLVDASSLSEETTYNPDTSPQDDGPLQIKSPYTERRMSIQHMPHSYCNPAFGYDPGSRNIKQRSLSIDLGTMTSPMTSQTKTLRPSVAMTSIKEQECDKLPSTSRDINPPLLRHNGKQLDNQLKQCKHLKANFTNFSHKYSTNRHFNKHVDSKVDAKHTNKTSDRRHTLATVISVDQSTE